LQEILNIENKLLNKIQQNLKEIFKGKLGQAIYIVGIS
jgi:hypothetical protein